MTYTIHSWANLIRVACQRTGENFDTLRPSMPWSELEKDIDADGYERGIGRLRFFVWGERFIFMPHEYDTVLHEIRWVPLDPAQPGFSVIRNSVSEEHLENMKPSSGDYFTTGHTYQLPSWATEVVLREDDSA